MMDDLTAAEALLSRLYGLYAVARDERRRNGRLTKATIARFRSLGDEARAAGADEIADDCVETVEYAQAGGLLQERDLYPRAERVRRARRRA